MNLLRLFYREPDICIGGEDNPYLRRWWVIPRNKRFNIYLHNILRSDDDRAPHDHPWWSLSICLKGAMLEHIYATDRDGTVRHIDSRCIIVSDFVFRSPTHLHRLESLEGCTCWTLFITGPAIREWGFQCDPETPAGGWRHWRLFTKPDSPGEAGQGCD